MMDNIHTCQILKLYVKLGINIYQRCNITPDDLQYAAIDAFINNLELPLITNQSLCGAKRSLKFCIKSDSALKLSIIAIIGTYTRVNNIIFFVSDDNNISDFIKDISKIRSSKYPGSVVSMCINRAYKTFKITSYDTGISRIISECDMMTIMSQLTDTDKSMTFYLDPDLLFYSTYMHNNTNSIWITRVSDPIQMVGSKGSQLMPILYDDLSINNLLRLNIGKSQMKVQELNTIRSQINAINSSIMSAVSKDNLCYCCAYMKRIHLVLCKFKSVDETLLETNLLTDFIGELEQ